MDSRAALGSEEYRWGMEAILQILMVQGMSQLSSKILDMEASISYLANTYEGEVQYINPLVIRIGNGISCFFF